MEHPYAYENPDYIKVMEDISNYDAIRILRTRTMDEIRKINDWGQRADFSHDGRRILFIEKTYGDAFELELLVADAE